MHKPFIFNILCSGPRASRRLACFLYYPTSTIRYERVERSFEMDANHALTFALAVSLSSMVIIIGAAFTGAYRFLKNIGIFKSHYYY